MNRNRYNQTTNQKLHKEFCEVCDCRDQEAIQHHHIIERTEANTSNHPSNIAIICSNCHSLAHSGRLEIIGVFPSTAKYGRKLVYKLDGVANIPGIEEPLFKPQNPQMKLR